MNETIQPQNNMNETSQTRWVWIGVGVLVVVAVIGLAIAFVKKTGTKQVVQQQQQHEAMVQVPEPIIFGAMQLRPVQTTHRVGDEIPVVIQLDTKGSNITVARAYIVFDSSMLEVAEVRQNNSVLSMSIFEQTKADSVFVSRAAPGDGDVYDTDDGYTGEAGELATIVFKAKQPGQVLLSVNLDSSGMNADNGKGTELTVTTESVNLIIQ